MLHAYPSDVATIRRECRVRIVAHHTLSKVACLARSEIVEINIAIG